MPQYGIKVNTILGIKDPNTFTKWDKWVKVEDRDQQRLPSVIFPLINNYHTVNLEYIEDKLIEVHLRRNEDFDGDINEFIPVWEGEDTTPPEGYKFRQYPDVNGRIGAFIK